MEPAPDSILIIGAGVFGLSTAHAILSSPRYSSTTVTILDAYVPPPENAPLSLRPSSETSTNGTYSHSSLTASIDSSRIVRADYPTTAYSELGAEAQGLWRRGWPFEPGTEVNLGRSEGLRRRGKVYHETGLILTADQDGENPRAPEYVEKSFQNVIRLEQAAKDGAESTTNGDGRGSSARIRRLNSPASIAAAFHRIEETESSATPAIPAATATSPSASSASMSKTGANSYGSVGYINTNSGWADARAAMAGLRERVAALGASRTASAPLHWIYARAAKLLYSPNDLSDSQTHTHNVSGAVLESGECVKAALTILAAGAWSAALLPQSLGQRVRATGQPLAHMEVAEEEVERGLPVLLNMSSGMFVISPPAPEEGEDGRKEEVDNKEGNLNSSSKEASTANDRRVENTAGTNPAGKNRDGNKKPLLLKFARHAWGFTHTVNVPDTEPPISTVSSSPTKNLSQTTTTTTAAAEEQKTIPLLLPAPPLTPLPPTAHSACLNFLKRTHPHLLPSSSSSSSSSSSPSPFLPPPLSRLCWYTDTPTADFLIDFPPRYGRSLLVATGGSGHGFKFVPVLGRYILGRLEKKGQEQGEGGFGEEGTLADKLYQLWRWKSESEVLAERAAWWEGGVDGGGDGSRGGGGPVPLSLEPDLDT